jgi:hypothetical protein
MRNIPKIDIVVYLEMFIQYTYTSLSELPFSPIQTMIKKARTEACTEYRIIIIYFY